MHNMITDISYKDIIPDMGIYYPIGVYPRTDTGTHVWTHTGAQAYKHTDADARTEKSK